VPRGETSLSLPGFQETKILSLAKSLAWSGYRCLQTVFPRTPLPPVRNARCGGVLCPSPKRGTALGFSFPAQPMRPPSRDRSGVRHGSCRNAPPLPRRGATGSFRRIFGMDHFLSKMTMCYDLRHPVAESPHSFKSGTPPASDARQTITQRTPAASLRSTGAAFL